MLKLELLFELLKRNWKSNLIIFIIGFILFLYLQQWLSWKATVRELEREKINLQEARLIEKQKDSLAVVTLATENKKLKGLYESQVSYTITLKKQILNLKTQQDTTTEGQIRVSFAEKNNPCIYLEGYTLTATESKPEEAKITILDILPVRIKNDFIPVGKKVYSVITPSNPYFQIENSQAEIPPQYLKASNKGFGWKELIIGGGIGFLIGKVW